MESCFYGMVDEDYIKRVEESTEFLRRECGGEIAGDFYKSELRNIRGDNSKKSKSVWAIAGEQSWRKLISMRAAMIANFHEK